MEVRSAVALINGIVYKHGWKITAEDHTNRFEGAVKVRIEYPARDSKTEDAPEGYPHKIRTYAVFAIIVSDCDDTGIYRRIIDAILAIEAHETREFFRVKPTYWAPFHPHRVDGMKRWGNVQGDLQFGIA